MYLFSGKQNLNRLLNLGKIYFANRIKKLSWLIYIAGSSSNSQSKHNCYIVFCRTFQTAQSQIHISIPLSSAQMESESGSLNVNEPLQLLHFSWQKN